MQKFSDKELWRMLILYGLNTATYKIALGQCLYNFTEKDDVKSIIFRSLIHILQLNGCIYMTTYCGV